jgi:putative sigma-54 modulation protein
MIKLDITGRGYEVDDKLREYVSDKIGELDKYLPRAARKTAYARVWLVDDPNGREDNRFVCDVVITVPGEQFVSKEGTINMYAAVDIVEAKIKAQIRTYKDRHVTEPRRGRMLSRLIGRTSEAESTAPEIATPSPE